MEKNVEHSGDCPQAKCTPCSQPRWERGNEAGVMGGGGTNSSSQHGPFLVGADEVQPWTLQFRKCTDMLQCMQKWKQGKTRWTGWASTGSAHCKNSWTAWVWTLQGHLYADLSLLRFLTITKKITDKTCRLETLKLLRKNHGSWRDWAVVKSTCHLIIKIRVQTLTPQSGCPQTLVTQLQGIWCPLLALMGTYTHTRRWRNKDLNNKVMQIKISFTIVR